VDRFVFSRVRSKAKLLEARVAQARLLKEEAAQLGEAAGAIADETAARLLKEEAENTASSAIRVAPLPVSRFDMPAGEMFNGSPNGSTNGSPLSYGSRADEDVWRQVY
jgi:hypothetical protein